MTSIQTTFLLSHPRVNTFQNHSDRTTAPQVSQANALQPHSGDILLPLAKFASRPSGKRLAILEKFQNPYRLPIELESHALPRAGIMMGLIDIAGGRLASSYTEGRKCVTAGLDRLQFLSPPGKFNLVSTEALLTATGNRSMEVLVTVNAENTKAPARHKQPIAQGYLTFATIDERGMPVSPLPLDTPERRRMDMDANIRRKNRITERNMMLREKVSPKETRVQDSEVVPDTDVFYKTTQNDANTNNKVFGGITLEILYQSAAKAATAYTGAPVRIIRQDRMSFEKPGNIGDKLIAKSVITHISKQKQLEVQVDLAAEAPSWRDSLPFSIRRYFPAEKRVIASSYLIFEPQDPKTPIPIFSPVTDLQQKRWLAAELRQKSRQAENIELSKL